VIDTTYAMKGFWEEMRPRDLHFVVGVAGCAGHAHHKSIILGRLAALQTALLGRLHMSCR
jgi:hypothetical protein